MKAVFDICKKNHTKRNDFARENGQWPPKLPRWFILLHKPLVYNAKSEVDQDASESERRGQEEYYMTMTIEPVWYPASGDDHSALRRAFDQIAELPDIHPDHGWER